MKRLESRVALVTGAASGIGRAAALRLASEGAAVLITDINEEGGAETEKLILDAGGRADFAKHDVTDEQAWDAVLKQVVQEFGGLDILVNNAGVGDLSTIEETTFDAYRKTVSVTQDSVFLGMKHAGKLLIKSGRAKRASVINICSIFGSSGGFGTSVGYHAAKGAVRVMTKTLALHWASQGVRVNSIHPGFIDTPAVTSTKAMIELTPMGRLGSVEEVAGAMRFSRVMTRRSSRAPSSMSTVATWRGEGVDRFERGDSSRLNASCWLPRGVVDPRRLCC